MQETRNASQRRALIIFATIDELVSQIQRAHKQGKVDAHRATYLIHFVIDADQRRADAVKLWNAG